MKDTISKIIDHRVSSGELGRVMDQVAKNQGACSKWRNYHLIGDVIRGEVKATGNCMMDRIQQAIADEPTILAPSPEPPKVELSVAELGSETWKSAGMFAVAASIALMAILTLTPNSTPIERGSSVVAQSTENVSPEVALVKSSEPAQKEFEAEFGQMLVEHGEFTATSGLNGLIAYAKMVSNENLDE
ncbi:MAG: sigma-E factor negative regulatory protein [bacterium]